MFELTKERVLKAAKAVWGSEEEAFQKALAKRLVDKVLSNSTVNSYILRAISDVYPMEQFTSKQEFLLMKAQLHAKIPAFLQKLSLGADGEIAVRDFTLVTSFKA